MRHISPKAAEEIGVQALGLESTKFDFSSVETLAALLRRCGAFNCPCSPSTLMRSALPLLNGVRDDQQSRDSLVDLIEQLVSYGDLIESREITGRSAARLLYVAVPAFVEVSPNKFVILGIAADDNQLVPSDLARSIDYHGHARVLRSSDKTQTRMRLIAAGLMEIRSDDWLKAPQPQPASQHVRAYLNVLSQSERPGTVDELLVLNPDAPVRFYPGRWESLRRQTGTFVARRPQAYGAQLWAFVELVEGRLTRLVDFPVYEKKWRACDEAWHLQQAVDANCGRPQLYRVRTGTESNVAIVDVFSPIPSWAQRRWDCTGARVPRLHSLLAYEFDRSSLEAELNFARERMWLAEVARGED